MLYLSPPQPPFTRPQAKFTPKSQKARAAGLEFVSRISVVKVERKREKRKKKERKKGDGEPFKLAPELSATHANERAKRAREPICSEEASEASERATVQRASELKISQGPNKIHHFLKGGRPLRVSNILEHA